MKMFKATVAAIALTTMVGAPVLAQAAGRVAAASSEESEAEGSTGIIIGVVAAAAVIGGIIVIALGIYVILRERQLGLARREQREDGPSRMT